MFLLILKIFFIILGTVVLFLVYRKYPGLALIAIPVSIVVGQVFTLKIGTYSYEITLAEILIGLFLILFLFNKFLKRDFSFNLTSCGFYFLLYVGLMVLSFLWASNTAKYLISVRTLLFHFALLFIVINSVKDYKNFKKALWALPLTGLAVGIQLTYRVYDLGGFITYAIPERTEIVTRVGSWVFIAAIIILTVPLTYGLAMITRKIWPAIFLWGITIFSSIASLLPLGKGEILSLFCGLFYLTSRFKQKRIVTVFTLVIILLLIALPLASFSSKFLERLKGTFTDPNTRFRIAQYKTEWEIFKEHPLIGVGAGNLKIENQMRLPYRVQVESNNFIMQTVCELGILGLLFLILIIRSIWYTTKAIRDKIKTNKEKILLYAFCATFLIAVLNGLVEVTFIGLNYGIVFWYIIGLLVVWNSILSRSRIRLMSR